MPLKSINLCHGDKLIWFAFSLFLFFFFVLFFFGLSLPLQNDVSNIPDLTFSMDADEEKHILYEKNQVSSCTCLNFFFVFSLLPLLFSFYFFISFTLC